jgi:hypothetical protein
MRGRVSLNPFICLLSRRVLPGATGPAGAAGPTNDTATAADATDLLSPTATTTNRKPRNRVVESGWGQIALKRHLTLPRGHSSAHRLNIRAQRRPRPQTAGSSKGPLSTRDPCSQQSRQVHPESTGRSFLVLSQVLDPGGLNANVLLANEGRGRRRQAYAGTKRAEVAGAGEARGADRLGTSGTLGAVERRMGDARPGRATVPTRRTGARESEKSLDGNVLIGGERA